MHRTGGLEVVEFDRFQQYVEIVGNWWENAITLLFFNLMTWKAQIRCKVIYTRSNFCLILVIYCGFWPKNGSKSFVPSFQLKFDDVTATLSLIALSRNIFHKLILILYYSMPTLVKIECHLHGQKNKSTLQNLQNPYCSIVLANIWWRHCYVVFSCIVMNFFHKLTFVLSYVIPKFVKIRCHLQSKRNRSTFAQWWEGVVATPQHLPFL